MKLLIVDDSERVRGLINRLLGGLCEAVHECDDGSQALAAYEEFLPDWVLMDLRMKDVDGLEATRRIVAADREAHVVIVTNCDDERMRELATEAGACGYVLKEDLTALRGMLTAARIEDPHSL
jgi:CheY-like chemotaxis protein